MTPYYYLLIALSVIGVILIFTSFFGLPDKPKLQDHRSRTLATLGIAFVSFGVAIGAYFIKDEIDLEHERKTASLNFVKSMLQFGTSANHMKFILESCYSDFSDEKCQVRVALGTRLSGLLPSIDFTFGQVARGSRAFAVTSRLATRLLDDEIGLKVRLPVVVPSDIRKMGPPSAGKATAIKAFLANIDDFEVAAHEMSAIYCMFAEGAGQSWEEFDGIVKKLEGVIGDAGSQRDKLKLVQDKAKGLRAADVDCTNVPAAVREKLPFGGGDGGGGGAN